ncbi:MAG: hypothetical protein A3G45_00320 [Candidatus Staskawiczbacteria bacterium RIFCSPLOWO2_12_FULL_37_15]|uniref:Uncharacterized protein n=1 Tax=Candidatus Staskawiczbacteria bacterium RIFCSPLOWO2_12_FULL_37_15 TaxID=1802218 RepID=A0A1G2IPT7_9BACT|nr:MAG: hypothetical protein A3G45_00320 [Candidatus Staskawiczbacteria bacterium RIFCSPLOWO2_12_FULL_37_15]OHA25912.1 MAG: hypothetical protein A3D52_02955 [Candidatus Taylorbacteria bacterium RIFCSPHIGHO2_02_FULL_44_36]
MFAGRNSNERGSGKIGFPRGGKIETEGFQGETDLLACESNLFRREILGPATKVNQSHSSRVALIYFISQK